MKFRSWERLCGIDWRGGSRWIMPPRRFLGTSEIFRDNSTGTGAFFVLFVCIWSWEFNHSTALFD